MFVDSQCSASGKEIEVENDKDAFNFGRLIVLDHSKNRICLLVKSLYDNELMNAMRIALNCLYYIRCVCCLP